MREEDLDAVTRMMLKTGRNALLDRLRRGGGVVLCLVCMDERGRERERMLIQMNEERKEAKSRLGIKIWWSSPRKGRGEEE